MYSSSLPWCPVLAQFGHSLCWHSPCRSVRPTLPMARGAAPVPNSPAGTGRPQPRPATTSLLPRALQGCTPWRRSQGHSLAPSLWQNSQWRVIKHTKIPLERKGEMEEGGPGNFRDIWRDRPWPGGENTAPSSGAGHCCKTLHQDMLINPLLPR